MIGLVVVVAGAHASAGQSPAASAREAVLAAAAESLFAVATRARSADEVLLAADAVTARALAAPARRAGRPVRVAAGPTYCAARDGAVRSVGAAAALSLDSLQAARAVVRWTVTCLLESPYQPAPFAGGEGGGFELTRRGRTWRVTRSLGAFAL